MAEPVTLSTVWDDRLITAVAAWQLAEEWPLRLELRETGPEDTRGPGRMLHVLACQAPVEAATAKGRICEQAVIAHRVGPASPGITPRDVVTAVLKHRVMAHNLTLSLGSQDIPRDTSWCPLPGHAGRTSRSDGALLCLTCGMVVKGPDAPAASA